ncbi:MAG: RidA family protein [Rhizobiales bacterium]|nr:RidA family protein [Hyphomicrobiales bacterium]
MITRLSGNVSTRARGVIADNHVFTVAVASDKVPSMYEQTKAALAGIDKNLAEAGTDKSRILTAIVYIADMAKKEEMNRAWDEWVDRANPPMRACLGVVLDGKDLVEVVVTAVK